MVLKTLEQELKQVEKKHHSRIAMIIGEGSVFIILLSFGIYRVKKSFEKETQLARQQKNFMLSVTHELKTPLAAIKLNLQTIEKRDLNKEQQKVSLNSNSSIILFLYICDKNLLIQGMFYKNQFLFFYRAH